MPDINYREENIEDIQHLISSDIVLLITATSIESAETHNVMKPFPEYENIVKVYAGALTLYLGTFGLYRVAHLQCSMGSQGRDSSIITIKEALGIVNTKVVVMPGIAFGCDATTQKIGDVLLAEAVQPYNNKRVGVTEVQRGIALQTSRHLLNRFKSVAGWEFYLDGNSKSELITGIILSGEELIDNIMHRDELFNQFPNAKGGEMEGAGLYAACDGNVNCILIKGICDFADGEKGKNKSKNQSLAVKAALSYCMEV
jgi:nucleoside phosphorylase